MSAINVSRYAVGRLYNSMSHDIMEMRGNRINRRYLPSNRAQNSSPLGPDTLHYVNNIRLSSAILHESISDLAYWTASSDTGTVGDLVDGYNSLYSEAVVNSVDRKAENLAAKMYRIAATHAGSLTEVGIDVDQYGVMKIDTENLDTAMKSGIAEQFFTEDRSYSFTNQLDVLANSVTSNTTNYISRLDFGNHLTEKFTYTSTGEFTQYNHFSSGLIFDYSL